MKSIKMGHPDFFFFYYIHLGIESDTISGQEESAQVGKRLIFINKNKLIFS